jgi:hypothetical protein
VDDSSSVVLAAQYIDLFPWTAFGASCRTGASGKGGKGSDRTHSPSCSGTKPTCAPQLFSSALRTRWAPLLRREAGGTSRETLPLTVCGRRVERARGGEGGATEGGDCRHFGWCEPSPRASMCRFKRAKKRPKPFWSEPPQQASLWLKPAPVQRDQPVLHRVPPVHLPSQIAVTNECRSRPMPAPATTSYLHNSITVPI